MVSYSSGTWTAVRNELQIQNSLQTPFNLQLEIAVIPLPLVAVLGIPFVPAADGRALLHLTLFHHCFSRYSGRRLE